MAQISDNCSILKWLCNSGLAFISLVYKSCINCKQSFILWLSCFTLEIFDSYDPLCRIDHFQKRIFTNYLHLHPSSGCTEDSLFLPLSRTKTLPHSHPPSASFLSFPVLIKGPQSEISFSSHIKCSARSAPQVIGAKSLSSLHINCSSLPPPLTPIIQGTSTPTFPSTKILQGFSVLHTNSGDPSGTWTQHRPQSITAKNLWGKLQKKILTYKHFVSHPITQQHIIELSWSIWTTLNGTRGQHGLAQHGPSTGHGLCRNRIRT